MQVKVLYFGALKELVGLAEQTVDIPPDTTIGTLFETCFHGYETLRQKRSSILFARNHQFAPTDTVLSPNDEVAFLPPVSGGSDAALRPRQDGHLFALVHRPIDACSLAAMLQRPEDGAVVTFEGVVRNNTNGRTTIHLEYECYEQLALAQMTRIGLEVAAVFQLRALAIVHRLGRLQIGEPSVAIVACSPHRPAAFDGARETIDRLKREVPIWKKEFFSDGSEWTEGQWDEKLAAAT